MGLECFSCRPHILVGGAGSDEEGEAIEDDGAGADEEPILDEDEALGVTGWEHFTTPPCPLSTREEIEAADDADWEGCQVLFKPLVDNGQLIMRQFFSPSEPGVDSRDRADVLEDEYICALPSVQELRGKTLLLVSETSTRKSFHIREFIKEQCKGMNIIFVTCRCSHAGDAYTQLKEMGFAVYNKKGEQDGGPILDEDSAGTSRMIVQVRYCC